jgi:peptidoglycan/LPS O-acetylase OafA/YrhL
MRFAFLDGIRGVAAILIMMRHSEGFWSIQFYRSYLAVDLFFILSGFVIGHAYDEKLKTKQLTIPKFFLVRLIRLYPVFLLSLVISSIAIFHSFSPLSHNEIRILTILTLTTAFFIPANYAGHNGLFAINGPYWSLFYEIVINFLYAVIRPILKNWVLILIVVFSGFMLFAVSFLHKNLDAGAWLNLPSIVAGLSRAFFGIFVGLLLFRHYDFLESKLKKVLNPWAGFILTIIVLVSPSIGRFNWLVDPILTCLIFPICVLAMSFSKTSRLEKVLLYLGSASYPIYVLHAPVSDFLVSYLSGLEYEYAPFSGIILSCLLIWISASLIEKYYDIPIRNRLSRILLPRPSK